MSVMEAVSAYKRGTPLRANSKQHTEDLTVIRNASRPIEKADRLSAQRREEKIVSKIEAMLRELQGRRKRYRYDQNAATQIEKLWDGPLDPMTQVPLWVELLRKTKGKTVDHKTFIGTAIAILSQHKLYDPVSMAN